MNNLNAKIIFAVVVACGILYELFRIHSLTKKLLDEQESIEEQTDENH